MERGAGSPQELVTLAGWEKASENFFKGNLMDKISRVGEQRKSVGCVGEKTLYKPNRMWMRAHGRRERSAEQHIVAEMFTYSHDSAVLKLCTSA